MVLPRRDVSGPCAGHPPDPPTLEPEILQGTVAFCLGQAVPETMLDSGRAEAIHAAESGP